MPQASVFLNLVGNQMPPRGQLVEENKTWGSVLREAMLAEQAKGGDAIDSKKD